MARTQSFSIRDFSGGMVKGIGERDLAPNQMTDLKGLDNKKATMLQTMPTLAKNHISREAGEPSGYVLERVPIGSYGCYTFGTDHTLSEDDEPTNYDFVSVVQTAGRRTKWKFTIPYGWNTQWSGTPWNIDASGYGTINTFTAVTLGAPVETYGWQLALNTTLGSCKDAINSVPNQTDLDVTAVLDPGMTQPSGATGGGAGTNDDEALLWIESDQDGSTYSGVEITIYSTITLGGSE